MDHKPLELWKQRMADKKASGLNVTDWCDKNNLTKHAYYYWMKRMKMDTQKSDALIPVFAEVEPAYITQRQAIKRWKKSGRKENTTKENTPTTKTTQ